MIGGTKIPLRSKKIIAITGPRRSGKIYLLFQIIKKLKILLFTKRADSLTKKSLCC
ncbi:MAG TPA: hypothetical protein ENI03_02410 [Thermodesulfobacterium geofontis]|nr:hypothetical protein [Thermodesulfobacterium geofontis]